MNQSLHDTGIQLQLRHQPLHQPVMRSETGRHGGETERMVYGNLFGRRGNNFTGTWWTAVPPQRRFWYKTPKLASATPSMSHCVCLFFFFFPPLSFCDCGSRDVGLGLYLSRLSERPLRCGAWAAEHKPQDQPGRPVVLCGVTRRYAAPLCQQGLWVRKGVIRSRGKQCKQWVTSGNPQGCCPFKSQPLIANSPNFLFQGLNWKRLTRSFSIVVTERIF